MPLTRRMSGPFNIIRVSSHLSNISSLIGFSIIIEAELIRLSCSASTIEVFSVFIKPDKLEKGSD